MLKLFKWFLGIMAVVIFTACGGESGNDGENSIENGLENLSNNTENVDIDTIKDIDIKPSAICMKAGSTKNIQVIGKSHGSNRDKVNITGKATIYSLDPDFVEVISQNNTNSTLKAKIPAVVVIQASISNLEDTNYVGIVPSNVKLPIIMKKGCSFVYYRSEGVCGIAYKSKPRGLYASGSGFSLSGVTVKNCQITRNTNNVPVIEIDQ